MEKSPTFYIDSNVLINAAANDGILGAKARELIKGIQNSDVFAVTSCLSLDELLWVLRKAKSNEFAVEACRTFLISKIRFLDVSKSILDNSLDIISEFFLKPRDAIHVATMKLNNLQVVISEDSDLDKIKWIQRMSVVNVQI